MPMTPGLVPNIRQLAPEMPNIASNDDDLVVQVDDDAPAVDKDAKGNILRIEHPDGSISISLNGKGIGSEETEAERAKDWFRNLVDDIDGGELTRIAEELMRGVGDDIESRREWIEDRAQGIKLLGL